MQTDIGEASFVLRRRVFIKVVSRDQFPSVGQTDPLSLLFFRKMSDLVRSVRRDKGPSELVVKTHQREEQPRSMLVDVGVAFYFPLRERMPVVVGSCLSKSLANAVGIRLPSRPFPSPASL